MTLHPSYLNFICIAVSILTSCSPIQRSQSSDIDSSRDYTGELVLRYEDKVYVDYVATAQLYPSGNPLDLPILTLGVPQALELHFDDLSSELQNYSYRLIHCNADWTRSNLIEMQYIDGFFNDYITDYQVSFNTLIPFVHYALQFPKQGMELKISGNYLLVVSVNDDLENPILTKRFMVVEPRVIIEPRVRQSSTIDDRKSAQSVDFLVQHPSFIIGNPLRDLKTMVLQNGRWDNLKTGLRPTFIHTNSLEYRYEQGEDFLAGNEYRKFNISSTRYTTEDVTAIYRDSLRYVALLMPDLTRERLGYRTWRDINGRFLVRNTDGFNSITEGDYVSVTFTLKRSSALGKDVYVVGGFSNYKMDRKYRMTYDENLKAYSITLPFKQGYYEYLYAVKSAEDGSADVSVLEGSYYETENDYTVLIYYRDIGNDYDQLIGAKTVSTRDVF